MMKLPSLPFRESCFCAATAKTASATNGKASLRRPSMLLLKEVRRRHLAQVRGAPELRARIHDKQRRIHSHVTLCDHELPIAMPFEAIAIHGCLLFSGDDAHFSF